MLCCVVIRTHAQIEGVLAAFAGVGFGFGVPMIFEAAEKRDATRLDDVRELTRETLRTTGETLSDVSTPTNMVQRILRNEESCKSLVM